MPRIFSDASRFLLDLIDSWTDIAMGIVASVLIPPCIIGTGCCLAHGNFGLLLGCLPLIVCELAHVITDEALLSEGQLSIDNAVQEAAHWNVLHFGIRCYSLNCCGRWNHVLDTVRRILAPCSSCFSGRMVHDVLVAFIEDPDSETQAFVLLSKAHNGNLNIHFCQNMEEVDIKGKPDIFGNSKRGWWRAIAKSPALTVQDLVDTCSLIPAEYQPVSNNCHHFSKELWNWHAMKLLEEDGRGERLIQFPKGRCRSGPLFLPKS